MSYNIESRNGVVGHVASVQGLADVLDFAKRVVVRGPLVDFLNTGQTTDIPGVIKEIYLYAPLTTSIDVKATLMLMRNLLESVQSFGWAMIGD